MRKAATVLGVVVLLLAGGLTAQQKRQQDIDLQAAIRTETVDGNLREAIKQFDVIAGKYKTDHAIAAQALVHMAECYQKLGDAESRKIYQRIVLEFSDQREFVSLARTRLGADVGGTSRPMVLRRVSSGPGADNEGGISWDGRFVSFPDWETGDLAVLDLATNTTRHLTEHGTRQGNYVDYAEESAISRDGTTVAYSWFNGKDRYELRTLPLQASSPTVSARRLYDNPEVSWMAPYEWSSDGKWIAVQIQRKDRTTQIGLVSTQDGALRVLKTVNWRGTSRICLSPDGKFVAYDLPSTDTATSDRDVFMLAVDGSRESRVLGGPGQNRVMAFSPDGQRLLFGSDRGGSFGLWSSLVSDGRADAPPVLIKADIAPSAIGITRAGALFVVARIGNTDVHVASVDLDSGKVLSAPANVVSHFVGTNIQPEWSPDGNRLAFVSNRDVGHNNRVIVIRDEDTGKLHEVHPELDYFGPPHWTPDNRALLVKGSDLKGRKGVYRVDAVTGDLQFLVADGGTGNGQPQMSADGTKIYFWNGEVLATNPGSAYVERDLESGASREIFRDRGPFWPSLSPDGQYLAGTTKDDKSGVASLELIRVDNGVRRELFRVSMPQSLRNTVAWTPDSKALVVTRDEKTVSDLLVVPLIGDPVRTLQLSVPYLWGGVVRLHPDGHHMAFASGLGRGELWTLENFLPAQSGAK